MEDSSHPEVNSRKLEHGLRMTRARIPFSVPFGVWR